MGVGIVFLLALVIVMGAVLFMLAALTKRGGKLNVEKYRVKWLDIERSLVQGSESSYIVAVLNADKLVDQAMKDLGISGGSMGERLKNAKDKFSHRNDLWTSHKLRNQLAHEDGVKINYNQARRALAGFKRALKDLGAI